MLTREEYEAKRQARLERLQNAAARAAQESDALLNQAHRLADVIPFGQPILVGHYSEGRDRNYRGRIESKFRHGFELYRESQDLAARAESAGDNTAIYSDDPDAGDKIESKIAKLEAEQNRMKAINKAIKKNDRAALGALGYNEQEITNWLTKPMPYCRGLGYPAYALANNNGNIRRLKERIQIVAHKQAQADTTREVNGVRIEECPSENRIRLFYPGKPAEETRTELQQHGFRWTPMLGCWQAYYNANAKYYADQISDPRTGV